MVLNFIISTLFFCSFIISHPVHVSVTNVEYNIEQERMNISFKIFKKDMQLLFVHLNQVEIDFDDSSSINSNRDRISNYFSNHFDIEYEKDFEMKFKEYKIEDEYIYFYYNAEMGRIENDVKIKNNILLDLYYDQKNMVIFSFKNKEKGILFNIEKTSETININEL